MAGLVPAIHEARLQKDLRRSGLCTLSFEIVETEARLGGG
jgi:hypothetical protein